MTVRRGSSPGKTLTLRRTDGRGFLSLFFFLFLPRRMRYQAGIFSENGGNKSRNVISVNILLPAKSADEEQKKKKKKRRNRKRRETKDKNAPAARYFA